MEQVLDPSPEERLQGSSTGGSFGQLLFSTSFFQLFVLGLFFPANISEQWKDLNRL